MLVSLLAGTLALLSALLDDPAKKRGVLVVACTLLGGILLTNYYVSLDHYLHAASQAQVLAAGHWAVSGYPAGVLVVCFAAALLAAAIPHRGQSALRQMGGRAGFDEHQQRDSLTGLYNRHGFVEAVDRRLARAGGGRVGTLFLIGLDGFRAVNAHYGPAVGDAALEEVGLRLQGAAGVDCLVGRAGGDQFVVWVSDAGSPAGPLIERFRCDVIEPLAQPVEAEGKSVALSCSVGAVDVVKPMRAEKALLDAEYALRQVKLRGGNGIVFCDATMLEAVADQVQLTEDLSSALDRDELRMHYQPKLDDRRRVIGFEALVRWQHPVQGLLGPVRFIPLAERAGLMSKLGRRVVEIVCRQIQSWHDRGVAVPGRVSINVAPSHFLEPDFMAHLRQTMERYQVQPGEIEIELTEAVVLDISQRAINRLGILRAMGVTVALDDFGTGYSSLQYLSELPVDTLKVDRCFVLGLHNEKGERLMRGVLNLGRGMRLRVLVEGVETERDEAKLKELGCKAFQGFLYAKPLKPEELEAWLQKAAAGAVLGATAESA
jgi:diguanylate cyclase (GGDEF)-like protein